MWHSSALAFFFFPAVGIGSPGTPSRLMQPARVFKGCWVPSPALSGSHKGFIKCRVGRPDAGGLWKWVLSSAPSCVACVCVWCAAAHARVCVCWLHASAASDVGACACFPPTQGLCPSTPPKRCASQSAERQHDLKQVPREEKLGQRRGRKLGGGQRPVNKRRERKNGAGLPKVSLWSLFQVFVHCKQRRSNTAGSERLRHASADGCRYVQATCIYPLFLISVTV